MIASPCFYFGGNAVGSIGVVGPTRIEYDRLISIVDYIAKLFERVLDPENSTNNHRKARFEMEARHRNPKDV